MLNIIQKLNSGWWKGQAILHCHNDSSYRREIQPEAAVSQRWVGDGPSVVAHLLHTFPLCSAVEEEFAVPRDTDRSFCGHCAPESSADQGEIWDLGAGIFDSDLLGFP